MNGKTAIVLLHGIGDQAEGATLRSFQSALKRDGYAADVDDPTLRHVTLPGDGFRYFYADSKIEGKDVNISEFYWADLSRVSTGFVATLRNFLRLALDAPDIIYACLSPRVASGEYQDYFLLRCLRASVALSLWTIYFPIVALNLSYAVVVTGFALHAKWDQNVTLESPAAWTVLVTTLTAALIAATLLRFVRHKQIWAFIAMALAVFVVLIGMSVYDIAVLAEDRSFRRYSDLINVGLYGLWFVAFAANGVYLILLPILLVLFRHRWRGILLGFATAFLVFRFWLLLITTVWLFYLNQIFANQIYASLVKQISSSLQLIGLVWIDLVVIGILLVLSFGLYLKKSHVNHEKLTGSRYPRLIVPLSVLVFSVFLTGVWIAAFSFCVADVRPGPEPAVCGVASYSTELIVRFAAPILLIGGILVQFLHAGFEVSNDIVNYFKSNRGHRRVLPWTAMRTVFFFRSPGTIEFRQTLYDRLIDMIEDLKTKAGPFDNVLFVAHSLGSIIFIDIARMEQQQATGRASSELITMGSPYGSIFRYYFPHMFAPAALESVSAWTNIYRENDYVGTTMTSPGSNVIEHALPPRGHLGYFADKDAVKIIVERLRTAGAHR
ncbi:MAG: hypothetical protein ACR2PA_22505 [Hyphomicrobiaceae bacterium]